MSFYIKVIYILPSIISTESTRKRNFAVRKMCVCVLRFQISGRIGGILLIFKKTLTLYLNRKNPMYLRSIVKRKIKAPH